MTNLSGLFKVIYFFKCFFFLSDIRESVRFWFNLTFLWNYRYWHYLSRGSFTISVWCKICQMSYVLLATKTALHCMGRIGKIGLSILQKDKTMVWPSFLGGITLSWLIMMKIPINILTVEFWRIERHVRER